MPNFSPHDFLIGRRQNIDGSNSGSMSFPAELVLIDNDLSTDTPRIGKYLWIGTQVGNNSLLPFVQFQINT